MPDGCYDLNVGTESASINIIHNGDSLLSTVFSGSWDETETDGNFSANYSFCVGDYNNTDTLNIDNTDTSNVDNTDTLNIDNQFTIYDIISNSESHYFTRDD